MLSSTFVTIETAWMLVYAGGGTKLAGWLRQGSRMRWFNRASGGVFAGAGILLRSFRR
jgi:threonine/homoserine/homoserine lactone efflux protein